MNHMKNNLYPMNNKERENTIIQNPKEISIESLIESNAHGYLSTHQPSMDNVACK